MSFIIIRLINNCTVCWYVAMVGLRARPHKIAARTEKHLCPHNYRSQWYVYTVQSVQHDVDASNNRTTSRRNNCEHAGATKIERLRDRHPVPCSSMLLLQLFIPYYYSLCTCIDGHVCGQHKSSNTRHCTKMFQHRFYKPLASASLHR